MKFQQLIQSLNELAGEVDEFLLSIVAEVTDDEADDPTSVYHQADLVERTLGEILNLAYVAEHQFKIEYSERLDFLADQVLDSE